MGEAMDTQTMSQKERELTGRIYELEHQQSLVGSLLGIESPNSEILDKFNKIIREDFWELDRKLHAPSARSDYQTLSAIKQELQLLIGFPEIKMKSVVGVCGGFSSGKSALINSFIRSNHSNNVKLTEGVNPVTAVASYVTHHPNVQMRAYAPNGGSCVLSNAHYKQLDHEAQKKLPIDLKRLMSCVSIGLPMEHSEIFSELCMIDTPGYNPATSGGTVADRKTASTFAKQSDALLWVMNVEFGTFPQGDLDFLNHLKDDGFLGKLYIVINKADLRSQSDGENVMAVVKDTLDFDGIDYEGISLYSSSSKQEMSYDKQSLLEFLSACRNTKSISQTACDKIDAIFGGYAELIKQRQDGLKAVERQFKSLRLNVLKASDRDAYDAVGKGMSKIKKHIESQFDFDVNEIESEIDKMRLELKGLIYQFENELKVA